MEQQLNRILETSMVLGIFELEQIIEMELLVNDKNIQTISASDLACNVIKE